MLEEYLPHRKLFMILTVKAYTFVHFYRSYENIFYDGEYSPKIILFLFFN